MPTVDFITFCCPKDIERLAAPNELDRRVKSHKWPFDNVIVVRQRCRGLFDNLHLSSSKFTVTELESEDYPNILSDYGLPEDDNVADKYTHGPTAPHYWKWHVINHLIGLSYSTADYIVFSDADCRIFNQIHPSWVKLAIDLYNNNYPHILVVSPSDGGTMQEGRLNVLGGVRLTKNMSQQMFLCNREHLKGIDFNIPWNWEFLAPGEPFQEFYYLLEGRIWRWMDKHGGYRAILNDDWRYWHDGWH